MVITPKFNEHKNLLCKEHWKAVGKGKLSTKKIESEKGFRHEAFPRHLKHTMDDNDLSFVIDDQLSLNFPRFVILCIHVGIHQMRVLVFECGKLFFYRAYTMFWKWLIKSCNVSISITCLQESST